VELASSAFTAGDRFFMICQTILFYPFKILVPLGYSVAYPFVKENGAWGIDYLAAPLLLLALAFAAWKYLRDQRDLLLGLALYLLPLAVMLPFRTVGNFELRSDRYAYLSLLGVAFFVFILLEKYAPKAQKSVMVVATILLAFLGLQQAAVWNNGVDLFKNCVDKTPESSLCQCNLAYNSLINRNFEAAIDHYSAALKYDATTIEAYNGRGQAYLETRKFQEAYSDFDNAIQKGLSSPKLFLNRGKCLVINGQPDKAIPDLTHSLELEPKSHEAHYFRAVAYDKGGKPDLAINDYTAALQLNPNYVEAMVNRGQIHFAAKDYPAAIGDFSKAIDIASNNVKPMILTNRANAYMLSGQTDKALQDVEAALAINPNFARAQQVKAALGK
jgi:tetratricopeptide (TPR) repeat protein